MKTHLEEKIQAPPWHSMKMSLFSSLSLSVTLPPYRSLDIGVFTLAQLNRKKTEPCTSIRPNRRDTINLNDRLTLNVLIDIILMVVADAAGIRCSISQLRRNFSLTWALFRIFRFLSRSLSIGSAFRLNVIDNKGENRLFCTALRSSCRTNSVKCH